MTEAHVFVCYGALSFDAAARIIEGVLEPSTPTYVLAMFSAELSRLPERTVVLAPERELHQLSEWIKPFVIARWFRRVLDRLERDAIDRVVAYFPHPFELPANHFAYAEPKVARLELLPDGFLNYAETPPPEGIRKIRYWARVLLRSLAARRVGLRYRPLPAGHLTQYEVLRYERTWASSFEGILSVRGERARLPPPKAPTNQHRGGRTVLVLDQELLPLVTSKLEERIRGRLLEVVRALDADRVLYKAHPRGQHRLAWLERAGANVQDVTGPELAEQVIVQTGASCLVGFYSTPLLLSGALVERRISVLPDPDTVGVRKVQYLRGLRTALEGAGAEMVPLVSKSDGQPSSA